MRRLGLPRVRRLGVSLALPFHRLGPAQPEEGGERRWSLAGSLTVLTHRFEPREARPGTTPPTAPTPGTAPGTVRAEPS